VGAGYAELVAPVVRGVEVTGALRYDHYENVGSKTSPKVGARWQPVREVLVRGSVGKGFRAPALTELYQPQVTGVSAPGLTDTKRCGTTKSSNDCVTQFPITLGGNTALKPEISTNTTLGIVFEPINNASFSVDWWQVNLKETIVSGVSPAAILADQAKYGSYITRAAPDSTCAGCPGQITNIDQTNTNLGETRVQGLDVDLRYRMPAAAAGVYTVGLIGTYFLKYDLQTPDGSFSTINAGGLAVKRAAIQSKYRRVPSDSSAAPRGLSKPCCSIARANRPEFVSTDRRLPGNASATAAASASPSPISQIV